jgi:hypothetical protein
MTRTSAYVGVLATPEETDKTEGARCRRFTLGTLSHLRPLHAVVSRHLSLACVQSSEVFEVLNENHRFLIYAPRIVVLETHGVTIDGIELPVENGGWVSPQRGINPIKQERNRDA